MLNALKSAGIDFYCGVPDSTLNLLHEQLQSDTVLSHVIAACEGSAVALAIGYWLATAKVPCVYMQNSGLPNALNPLLSLAGPENFNVPMILVIGWRGEPGSADEPQHRAAGAQTGALLAAAGIASFHVKLNDANTLTQVFNAVALTVKENCRLALLVSPSFAQVSECRRPVATSPGLDKLDVMEAVLTHKSWDTLVAAGIGHTARQLMLLRSARGATTDGDLLCAGGMGYASHIAIALSIFSRRRVCVLDGDGAFLMHGLGNTLVGALPAARLTHIVLDNGCHASVGGAPVANPNVDYVALATAIGYRHARRVASLPELIEGLAAIEAGVGSGLLHVPIASETPQGLPRPSLSPSEQVRRFQARLGQGLNI